LAGRHDAHAFQRASAGIAILVGVMASGMFLLAHRRHFERIEEERLKACGKARSVTGISLSTPPKASSASSSRNR
jgi:hypothetical protein